ncbi:MAG: TolC family protein [Gemmatimonadales bacterium]|jgi:outer membrane protein TolC
MYKLCAHTALTLALAALPVRAGAQEPDIELRALSLDEAIAVALEDNAALAVAEARRDIAGSQGRKASSPLWPQLALESGYMRSVDPVAVFGTKLRQGNFGPEDLDFDVLNNPDAIDDWSTALGLRWSILDPKAWAGRSAARHQADAATWSATRTREATVLITRTLYYRAQTAASQLEAAESSLQATAATVESFQMRRERGLLTDADLLQAEAELAAARAQVLEAERAHLDAMQDLGRHLGWGPEVLPMPSDSLATPAPLQETDHNPRARADLLALEAAADAAGSASTRATLSWVPAIDAFARYSTHGAEAFSVDEDNWTVGVMLRWPLFTGFGRSADIQRAKLEKQIARIEYEQALRDAEAEVDKAERAVASALRQVEATQAASEAATAGRELMRRRFDEGLATAADLLQAEARSTSMRQRAIGALAAYYMAVARLDFVRSQSYQES